MKFLRKFCSVKSNQFFITTPIYYANAAPHLGHLYTNLIADTIHRFKKITTKDLTKTIFSTGTDEHGIKVLQSAAKNNEAVSTYCDNISNEYKRIFQASSVDTTDFVRTTDQNHKSAVQSFWNLLKSRDSIYKAKYSGWYSVQDESFLTESQLKTNNDGKKVSIESGHLVEWTEEENYMFKLKDYRDDVIYWAKQENRVAPKKFNKILLDYLNEDLPNISVSRPTVRMPWGIPVPDDASQNIYVWLDALTNYLTVSGYPNELQIWPPNIQVLGKDILKFHGIYWPAFLIAAGLEPPQHLLVHSHWTVDGQKMSKSIGNVINPEERAFIYTMEGIRYFLLREGVQHSDGNYSDTKILRILNSELADTLGNLLSRACAKTLNPQQIFPKLHKEEMRELLEMEVGKILVEKLAELGEKCHQHYTANNFHLVVDAVMSVLHAANNFFESTKPWELKKGNETQIRKLETIISITMEALKISGIILQPIIPIMSSNLLNRLNVPEKERTWKYTTLMLRQKSLSLTELESNILFKRIILDEKPTNKRKVQRAK